MKHVKSLNTKNLQKTLKKGGCGECQTSCQSACKTSCTASTSDSEGSEYIFKEIIQGSVKSRPLYHVRKKGYDSGVKYAGSPV